MERLLNLRALANADVNEFALVSFEGREAISECFDYRLELISSATVDLNAWIGQFCEFDVTPHEGGTRVFAGRIYSARRVLSNGPMRILIQVGPAYQALAYARATHFVQDRNSLDIFDALSADVPGLIKTTTVNPAPPARGYAVRYDETDIDFLARLLAQDGIMYFFEYDRGAGAFRHRMILTTKPDQYIDIAAGPVEFIADSHRAAVQVLERHHKAAPRKHSHMSFNVNKLDTPFLKESSSLDAWGAVYAHPEETIGFESKQQADLDSRQTASDQWQAQYADHIEGRSTEPSFMAGGRVEIVSAPGTIPKKVVLTSVQHSAIDTSHVLNGVPGEYHNSFTAIDARFVVRPQVNSPGRVAPGPMVGMVWDGGSAAGKVVVDDQWRVPVDVSNARDYSPKGLNRWVWLPVQQQWQHNNYGAQFMPRIGTRVIIDFLYGNPDLPIITGTVFNPSQPYPFNGEWTQSGWRSQTDGNGEIIQEFHFEDAPGGEEIYLYTGRDYRREIDNDDWGTIKGNQTLKVEKNREMNVDKNHTVIVKGQETKEVKQTRTITVTQKNMLESLQEIEFKVGSSTIKMTKKEIEIKAENIKITAEKKLDMKAGAAATFKGPMIDTVADGKLTLKGGVVLIN
jgi:type VI secretion system secreted protein VgrG